MIAVDTNIVLRFLVEADGDQSRSAKLLFEQNRVAVSHTVLLETEWVLRYHFRFDRERRMTALRDLLGVSSVVLPRPEAVLFAIEATEQGCDFADALHAATMQPEAEAFVTFDQRFARRARRMDGLPPVRLLVSGGRIEAV